MITRRNLNTQDDRSASHALDQYIVITANPTNDRDGSLLRWVNFINLSLSNERELKQLTVLLL